MSDLKINLEICAECNWPAPIGEIHTWLFCELHKLGHDRETIIANVTFTAEALRSVEEGKQ